MSLMTLNAACANQPVQWPVQTEEGMDSGTCRVCNDGPCCSGKAAVVGLSGRCQALQVTVVIVTEQVTYKRLKDAVQSLGNMSQQGPAAGLVDVLFGQRPPRFMANLPPWTPMNAGIYHCYCSSSVSKLCYWLVSVSRPSQCAALDAMGVGGDVC